LKQQQYKFMYKWSCAAVIFDLWVHLLSLFDLFSCYSMIEIFIVIAYSFNESWFIIVTSMFSTIVFSEQISNAAALTFFCALFIVTPGLIFHCHTWTCCSLPMPCQLLFISYGCYSSSTTVVLLVLKTAVTSSLDGFIAVLTAQH